MKIKLLSIVLGLVCNLFYAQDFSESWEGYFSYLDVNDVSKGEDKIFGASENAVFSYDFETKELETLSTIDGLIGDEISTIKYVEDNDILLIGYENGIIQIFVESSRELITVVDIYDKATIPPTDKRINHFYVYNGFAYISTDYGISVYNINDFEFGDTFFIGINGGLVEINQVAVLDDYIYAASETGLRRALINSSNLVDYDQWEQIDTNHYVGVETVNDKVYLARLNKRVYEFVGNSFNLKATYSYFIQDLRTASGKLVVTTNKQVFVYNTEDFSVLATAGNTPDYVSDFTSATLNGANELFIGTFGGYFDTGVRGYGLLKMSVFDTEIQEKIHPDSPLSNNAFSIKAIAQNLWVTYGDYTISLNPYPLRKRGVSHLKLGEWINIPADSLFNSSNLNTINVNPLNLNQVFISSFKDGLLELNNDEPTVLYGEGNSSFNSSSASSVLIRNGGSKIDNNGVLWCTNAKVLSPLKSLDITTGEWRSYDFSAILSSANSEFGYTKMDIGSDGIKWISGYKLGIIGFDSENNLLKNINDEEHNMPSSLVRGIAVDKNNAVWIGTLKGLRVIYNASEFFSNPDFVVSEIIVLDNGDASELLFQQFVNDIEVDGSNNKWVGTFGAGLYYFSSDGQETIYHFTKDNSPLPSNDIIDISLDEVNGIVYIATEKGMVSFKSETSKSEETLSEAYVYPNPVRPTFNITETKIKIKGLTENVNIKITDVEGNLVTEAESRTNLKFKGHNLEIDGGTALWNGKNLSDRVVASGVYLIMISDLDSLETKVLKVMIVR